MKQNRTGQFGWVVLLLATAVILPTVCLLWFMTQAVRNERLAVRQKLVDIYTERCQQLTRSMPNSYMDMRKDGIESVTFRPELYPEVFCEVAKADSFVLFGQDGIVKYPILSEQTGTARLSSAYNAAERMEFADGNSTAALIAYQGVMRDTQDETERLRATVAAARCMNRFGRSQEATELLEKAAYPNSVGSTAAATEVMRARVLLAQLYRDAKDSQLSPHLRRVLGNSHYSNETQGPTIPVACASDVRAWMLGRLVSIAQDAGLSETLKREIDTARRTIAIDELAMQVEPAYADVWSLGKWPGETIRRLGTEETLYGAHMPWHGEKILYVMTPAALIDKQMTLLAGDVATDAVVCRIFDDQGTMVAGTRGEGKPFVTVSMGKWMPDWRMELYFRDGSVFENAASRQAAVYTWTAFLVIALILAAATAAGVSVNRQIKLDRLKNDFVATVTHELKTPLSSMRVLVDTLLAGDCKDARQEKEYLELIARENLRLSRLIDNFLTFSRMERNKKAFDIRPSEPAKIVADAAEAVKTKFEGRKCQFTTDVGNGLPEVMADHDSVVTVLVNLLDNACKYSGDNKQISLKAFAENGDVCFAVKDNGFGMTKRVMRRIFDRFYQADQSLARSAEGCGLGLSIVKFIVDAHRGRIDVQSKPGEGSCFTVRLPAVGN